MPLRAENENPWTPAATTQKILAATLAHTHSSADAIYKEPMLWLIASIVLTHTLTIYADPRFVVEAAQRQEAPVIDADFTDWPGVLWLELAPKPAHQSPGYSPLRDDGNEELGIAGTAADLSAEFALAWNDTGIYLAARVTDNIRDVEGGQDHQWYFKDAVTLFLDIPGDGDGPGWIAGDHAFSFVSDPTYPSYGIWWRRGEKEGHVESPAPANTRAAVQWTAEGYALEASISMVPLTRLTPTWQKPFANRTIGFALIFTDPDGGQHPFGGQLIYGGRNDDDGGWTRLRLRDSATVSAPYIDISAEEMSFEARLRMDQQRIKPFFAVGADPTLVDSTDLQAHLAAEYFQTYLDRRPLRFSRRALEMAFMLWGNIGDADEIGRALARISPEEDLWDKVTTSVRQAYYLQGRLDEGMALLAAIESQVTPLKSRSALLYTLGQYWLSSEEQGRAHRAFTQIVAWRASPWHVHQARRYLPQMD